MRGRLAIAGIIAFAVILGSYLTYLAVHPYYWTLDPVNLGVYRSGGLIVRHVRPWYNPHLATPLYSWPGYENLHLKFTYPPFAALVFAVVSLIPWRALPPLSVAVNIAALLAALWFTFGGLGYRRGLTRLGATLLAAAAVFWTEPVIRTLYLGQVNLVLMALIIWDLCQPDTRRSGASRWWKGAGVGVAAGIKLVPLVFIPYLLLTRRFRAAAVACAAFAATVAAGLRGRARRFGPVVAGRPVLQRGPHRLRRLGGQPVAARPAHQAGRQRGRRRAGAGWRWRWSPRWPGWPARPCWTGPGIRCPGCSPAR